MSRFHGLLLVRDEADIIEECLRADLEWADSIWILDTGSTDETWDIVMRLAAEDERIRPLGKHDLLFGQHLRSYLFHIARDTFEDGDWVVKLDADEFYEIHPPEFVARYLSADEGCIFLQWLYFRITADEVAAYEKGEVDIAADRQRPIGERRRFYKITDHAEPRMFRYRRSMKFAATDSFPRFAGLVARRLIPVRHYPHRDPLQLRRRYELRARMKKLGAVECRHWDADDWRTDVVQSGLNFPHGERGEASAASGLALEAGHDPAHLEFWAPGDPLPVTFGRTDDEPGVKRGLKRFFYRWCVRVADRFVKGFDDDAFLDRNCVRSTREGPPPAEAVGESAF